MKTIRLLCVLFLVFYYGVNAENDKEETEVKGTRNRSGKKKKSNSAKELANSLKKTIGEYFINAGIQAANHAQDKVVQLAFDHLNDESPSESILSNESPPKMVPSQKEATVKKHNTRPNNSSLTRSEKSKKRKKRTDNFNPSTKQSTSKVPAPKKSKKIVKEKIEDSLDGV